MVWKALEGSAGFARFCEALGGFERLRKALQGFVRFWRLWDGFVMLWETLALEGFVKLLKSLPRLWEVLG